MNQNESGVMDQERQRAYDLGVADGCLLENTRIKQILELSASIRSNKYEAALIREQIAAIGKAVRRGKV